MNTLLLASTLWGAAPVIAQEPASVETADILNAQNGAFIQLTFDDDQATITVEGVDPVPAGTAALLQEVQDLQERVFDLESRLAILEDRPFSAPTAAPSSVSWTGGVEVAEGETVDDAVGYTGAVEVRGIVQGDAVSMVSDVHVLPGGRVLGDAVSFGGSVVVDAGGEVLGDRVALGGRSAVLTAAAPESALADVASGDNVLEHVKTMLHGFARRIAVLLSFAGLGVLIVGFWPSQLDHVARIITRRPIWYGIAGGILAALMGLGAIVFTLTMVGIPIALLLAVLLAIGWLVGIVAICKATGERFSAVRQHGNWASFLVGAALLMAVGMLPYVGPVILVAIGFPAVGAALISRLGSRRDPDVA